MLLVCVLTCSDSVNMALFWWWAVLRSAFLAPDYNVSSGVYA